MRPAHEDPNVPHPGMVFWRGQWRTPASVEQQRAYNRERDRRFRDEHPLATYEKNERTRARLRQQRREEQYGRRQAA